MESLVALPGPAADWDAPLVPALTFRTIETHARIDWNHVVSPDLNMRSLAAQDPSLPEHELDCLSAAPWASSGSITRTDSAIDTSDVPTADHALEFPGDGEHGWKSETDAGDKENEPQAEKAGEGKVMN